ncbi:MULTISPECIES: acyl-CoA synthetase [Streptomyces]|uniref:Acyl-CoA synthetase n=1 Tax=Streptomyces venezuelae TaxID=54571 RepID=A0A5P2BNE5_STRVZ|nr:MULTISPECIES: acyl-CoA synthetase [Streptomyces]NDZ98367.1 acyl-CoA synthetase [Streptomyces sp. SID10116]MYY86536.1 AMP-binding protein [Streptomyces sp. SID335]MYZ11864.1 AMP-binding protein [Streptomyces sp. SID337]NDZ86165.1 acyl-CoA synthetase [Streptomyces sp. SID10115]NEB49248.1 acyl-CoA synthetase [Streptomyces sp. SID339]
MTGVRDNTVDGVLRRSARRTPRRTALHYGERAWTYEELDGAVSRAAGVLRDSGLAHGDRVGAYAHNSDAYLIGFLACARAGLVHVPVNQNLTGDDLAYIVRQSGCSLVLADPDLAGHLPSGVPLLALRDADDSLLTRLAHASAYEGDGSRGDDLAQLLYTSGTTALPKGAMLSHRALVHEYVSAITALDLEETDRPVHSLPLYHSAQMHVFLMPYLAVGAESTILDGPDAERIFDLVEAGRADSLFAPPTVWIGLSRHPGFADRDLRALRKAYYGASVMPVPVLERLRARLPELAFYNCFGQSEIGPLATVLGPDEHEGRMDSCGRPVLFVEARVVDEDGREVPDGTQGEVVYRSPQLCEGYWDKPEETAEAFRDGWFRSGDLAVRDAEGYFTVVDRVKDVINSGGVLVASRQVEDVLYEHVGVAEAAVIGLPDDRWIEAVTAVVVRGDQDVTEDELIVHVRRKLASFKVPKRVLFVDELPRNASGKILKRELRDRFAAD